MWQSWLEVKRYFIAFFDHMTEFKALHHSTSTTSGARAAHMTCSTWYGFLCDL